MRAHSYAQELLAAAGPRPGYAASAELDATLERLVESARAAWPDVHVDAARFVRHLARHLPESTPELARIHVADLYLACACLDGDRHALAHFERAFLARVGSYVGRFAKSATFTDEVKQLLREKMFVATSGEPKIADYAGTGTLEGWVRVSAIRTAQNMVRTPTPNVALSDEDALALEDRAPNPELDYLRRRYARDFAEVFRQVLDEQPAKDKNLLALYFVDGLRSADIGKFYGVHGATVRRWVERARETLLKETRKRLAARLNLAPAEFESLMGFIHSQLDLTISRFMAKSPGSSETGS